MISESYQTKFGISHPEFQTGASSLSLDLSEGVLSYCLSSQTYKLPFEMGVHQFQTTSGKFSQVEALDFFLTNNRLLNRSFEKINISILNPDFTLLPKSFSSKNSVAALKFTLGKESKKHLHHHLAELDVIAAVNEELSSYLEKNLPGATVRHASAITLSLFFSQHSLQGTDVFLQLNGAQMELMAKQNSKLLFYNIYTAVSNEDVLYYLLFAMEQFGLEPNTVKLTFAGDRASTDDLLVMIAKYVKQLHFAAHDASLQLQGDFIKQPSHLYFHLLNQHLCE